MKPVPKLVVFLAVVFAPWLTGTVAAQTNITFPDPNLEMAVRFTLGKPTGPLANSDLDVLTSLTASRLSIANLSGLEWATNLTSLDVSGNSLSDLSPLAGLFNLSSLNVGNNLITDGSAIAGLTNLSSLCLFGDRLKSLTVLTNLTGLTSLTLYNSGIRDIQPLSVLTNLNYLELRWNPLTNADTVLPLLTNLTSLYLGGISISNVNFLQNLTRLTFLNLDHNQVSDPSPLAVLVNLRCLDLSYNPLTNVAQLGAFTNLTSLYLSGGSVSNLTVLQTLNQLTSLTLYSNVINNLSPLTGLANLSDLGLSWNPTANYEVLATCTNLTSLWLDGNSLSNVSFVQGLARLNALGLRHNRLSDLSGLGGLTNLVAVHAEHNRLTSIEALEDLPYLSSAGAVANLLDLTLGSPARTTILSLQSRGVNVTYLPQDQPPVIITASSNWIVAVGATSSLGLCVTDDVTPDNQLTVIASSSNTGLIPNESILHTSAGYWLTLTLTPAADQTGISTITLTVTDGAGSSTVITLHVTVAVPQLVVIPDPSLESVIRSSLGKAAGNLNNLDLLALTSLRGFDANITNLSGLEWAANLSFFSLVNDHTPDLSPLIGLPNLTGLHLQGGALSNLTLLQQLTQLTSLELDNNQIADLGPLSGLTNLTFISLRQNRLTNIAPLQNLAQLILCDVTLNLLDVSSNSPAVTVIQTLVGHGATVYYLPQRAPPTIEVRPAWVIVSNAISSLSFVVHETVVFASPFAVTASTSNTNLLPNQNIVVGNTTNADWFLYVTPTSNQTGATTITLTATNDAGLGSSKTILVTVVVPLPLDEQVLEGTNLLWLTGGNAPWFGQASVSHGGGFAAQSGSIQNDQESWLETTLNGPGILTFWWKVSSEAFFDWLEFSLNGLLQSGRIAGEVNWQQKVVEIPRGTQVARWRYFKERSDSGGLDTAWLDQVTFIPLSWLELVGRTNNGHCELLLHPVLGRLYQLQASTNVSAWFPLAVVAATNPAMPFVDLTANSSARFYRLQELSANSIRLQNPKWIANAFQLEVLSPSGLRFEVQASTDLVSWSGLGTISNALGTVQYTDMQATNSPKRFYRALLLP